jgi:hypothetical protein
MNLIEGVFQIIASILFKIGHHLKIDTITQYRVILSTVAMAQSLMVYAGLHFLLHGKLFYKNFDDMIALYAFAYVAIITMFTAISWRSVFSKKDGILPWREMQDVPEQEILQHLSKTRESYSIALSFTILSSIVFWFMLKNNTQLIMLFIIPISLEISANILATCWEISMLMSKSRIKTT